MPDDINTVLGISPDSPSQNDPEAGQVAPQTQAASATPSSPIQNSRVAGILTLFAVLEFIGAVIGALIAVAGTGESSNPGLGFSIFVCGILSGVIFLGFARLVENSFQSAQRLERIEALIQKSLNDKTSAYRSNSTN